MTEKVKVVVELEKDLYDRLLLKYKASHVREVEVLFNGHS